MKKLLIILLLVWIFVISGCDEEPEIIAKLAPQDFTIDSIKWDCPEKDCYYRKECSGGFEYTMKLDDVPNADSKLCKVFVDGKDYPYPNDEYRLGYTKWAGIPAQDVYEQHNVRVCCSNDFREFDKGNYDVCKEIVLEPLCSKVEAEPEVPLQERITQTTGETITTKDRAICGNDICEDGEGIACIDCPTSCKSDYCNSKITVYCEDCYDWQLDFLPTVFDYQNDMYDCLSDYFGYSPQRILVYSIDKGTSECQTECTSIGTAGLTGVHYYGFSGIHRTGESSVTNVEDLRADIHETTHVFTLNSLGSIPDWFNEGISIYVNERLSCHPKQHSEERLYWGNFSFYPEIKNGELDPQTIGYHQLGAVFFVGLERDYNCDTSCVGQILKSLKSYRENCVGDCFENFVEEYQSGKGCNQEDVVCSPFLSTNKDLAMPIINIKIIKQESEKVIGEDLTPLFNLLKITD